MCETYDALSGHGLSRAETVAKSPRLYRPRKKSKRCHPERSEGSQRLMFATTYANSTLRNMSADRRIGLFSATPLAAEVGLPALSQTSSRPCRRLSPSRTLPNPFQFLPNWPAPYPIFQFQEKVPLTYNYVLVIKIPAARNLNAQAGSPERPEFAPNNLEDEFKMPGKDAAKVGLEPRARQNLIGKPKIRTARKS